MYGLTFLSFLYFINPTSDLLLTVRHFYMRLEKWESALFSLVKLSL
jgi:hypothetical protein